MRPEITARTGETEFQRTVVDFARLLGWRVRVVDQRNARGQLRARHEDQQGWPDLLLVKDRVVWLELKAFGKSLSPTQVECIRELREAGAEVHVVTPAHWLSLQVFLEGDRSALDGLQWLGQVAP